MSDEGKGHFDQVNALVVHGNYTPLALQSYSSLFSIKFMLNIRKELQVSTKAVLVQDHFNYSISEILGSKLGKGVTNIAWAIA